MTTKMQSKSREFLGYVWITKRSELVAFSAFWAVSALAFFVLEVQANRVFWTVLISVLYWVFFLGGSLVEFLKAHNHEDNEGRL